MDQRFRTLTCFCAVVTLAAYSHDAVARPSSKHAHHAKQQTKENTKEHVKSAATAATHKHASAKVKSNAKDSSRVTSSKSSSIPLPRPRIDPSLLAAVSQSETTPASIPVATPLPPNLAAVKQALELVRKGQTTDATNVKKTTDDPAAQKLIEWTILRHPNGEASFARYAAFVADNPDWPGVRLLRRRAEARLWQERSSGAAVRNFVGEQPASCIGKFALARALLKDGDRSGAERLVRDAWRSQELSDSTEAEVLAAFGDIITRDDHRARMDKRIGAKDFSGAMRAAQRAGGDEKSVVKACAAVAANSAKATSLLDDVPGGVRGDLGYTLCRIQSLLRQDKVADAARVMLKASAATMALQDTDEWWRARRVLARKLLDQNEFEMAYQVVREAALPANENYRAEFHFMPGWIALRYRNDPAAARAHFAHIDDGSSNPIVIARANYWRGRAAEAAGDTEAMRASYQAAAGHPTAYYGQLARAKLDLEGVSLHAPPQPDPPQTDAIDERVRAADMLYTLGERDLVLTFVSDLAEQSSDVIVLSALGELTARRNDAQSMLALGKTALARGLALDHYAFPEIGVPRHTGIGPDLDRSVVFSVARTESAFNPRDVSPAKAVGLMQVTPDAGRDTAKRFGVTYDWNRLVSDSVYNTQMGAAELAALLREYRGSFIMTFAGYNAGRGRVQEWVKKYGDPRDPKVDATDWVERIPFAETRNYVQRVMENLQVYRARFDAAAMAASARAIDGVRREANSAPE
jgi:soluble lytic murein transglycosylase